MWQICDTLLFTDIIKIGVNDSDDSIESYLIQNRLRSEFSTNNVKTLTNAINPTSSVVQNLTELLVLSLC